MFLPLRRARWPLHTKMGRICKVAVEMTRRINRGESQTGYSPALGNPHQTRVPTFPQRRRRRGAWQRRGQTPLKSGSLPDSCTEPFLQAVAHLESNVYYHSRLYGNDTDVRDPSRVVCLLVCWFSCRGVFQAGSQPANQKTQIWLL